MEGIEGTFGPDIRQNAREEIVQAVLKANFVKGFFSVS
jgi:hypothetical protein